MGFFILVLLLYGSKTISRNAVWKNDYTLFTTDVRVSQGSAKAQNAAGGAMITKANSLTNEDEKKSLYQDAMIHLKKAIEIHPQYKNAYLLLGNGYYYLKDYDASIATYLKVLTIDPYYDEAENNLHLAYREAGRIAGAEKNDIDLAKKYLFKALDLKPNDYETVSLMGIAYGNEGNHKMAVEFFEKAVLLRPELAHAYVNLGYALLNLGEEDDAQINFQKAVRIDPKAMKN